MGMPLAKKYSSKKNRHDPDLPDNGGFKKNGYQWDIKDYVWLEYYGTDDYKKKMK